MSTAAAIAFYALWLAGPVFLSALLVLLVRRNLRNEYPAFFAYVAYQIAIVPLLFYFYHRPGDDYFYVYWATAAVSPLLGLAVIYELFQHAFKPFPNLKDLGRNLFGWAAVLGALMLVVFAASIAGEVTDRIMASVLVLQRSVRIMQCALVLLMVLFASRLGLTWRHHIMGIAAGFGIFAAMDLMVHSVAPRVDPSWHAWLNWFKSSVYLGSVMIWFGVLYRAEPERVPETRPAALETEAFSFALPESSLPPPPDSLLLSMEKMVERRLNGHTNGGNGNGAGQKRNGNGTGHTRH